MVFALENRAIRSAVFFLTSLSFTLFIAGNPFFWDSVGQMSVPANWYYDNDFASFFLPDEIATGHPSLAGMYLALIWKVFERSLFVSHMAMFPFIFGIFLQLYRMIARADLNLRDTLLTLTVVLCDATLVSQMSMITFDIPQIFFYLWCINSILDRRKTSLSIAFAALMLTSLRGSLTGFGVILFSLIHYHREEGWLLIKKTFQFIPGLFLFSLYFLFFYLEKNWIIFNPDSSSYEHFAQFASFPEILRNIGIAGWRLVDFGRLGIWLVLVFIFSTSIRKKTFPDEFSRDMFLIALCQFLIFFSIVIFFKNPFGHRYFLPVIIPVAVAVVSWILKYLKHKYLIYSVILILTLSGYFWVYPGGTSTGWDATPAHWSYFRVRNEMLSEVNELGIPHDEICSFFPNNTPSGFTDLDFPGILINDVETGENCRYILYSNVFNLNDRKIEEIFNKTEWSQLIEKHRCQVSMILFKRNSE